MTIRREEGRRGEGAKKEEGTGREDEADHPAATAAGALESEADEAAAAVAVAAPGAAATPLRRTTRAATKAMSSKKPVRGEERQQQDRSGANHHDDDAAAGAARNHEDDEYRGRDRRGGGRPAPPPSLAAAAATPLRRATRAATRALSARKPPRQEEGGAAAAAGGEGRGAGSSSEDNGNIKGERDGGGGRDGDVGGGSAREPAPPPPMKSTTPSPKASSSSPPPPPPKPPSSWRLSLKVLALCAACRIANVGLVRSYFDPDEFWQNLEPAYCLAFSSDKEGSGGVGGAGPAPPGAGPYLSCPGFTWEWKRRPSPSATPLSNSSSPAAPAGLVSAFLHSQSHWWEGPVRSHLSLLPTYLLYRVLGRLGWDAPYWVSRGPLLLNAAGAAAPVDLCVWLAARFLYPGDDSAPAWCLFASLVSWFNAYSLVRTYSNSQETLLLALAVALTAPELFSGAGLWEEAAASSSTLRSRFPRPLVRALLAFYLGGLCAAVRVTALAAFVPLGILLAVRRASSTAAPRGGGSSAASSAASALRRAGAVAGYLLAPCAAGGIASIATAAVVDRAFYGFWTLPLVGLVHFNVIEDRASLYGTHPWHWYLTAGLPAVAGILLAVPPLRWMIRWRKNRLGGSPACEPDPAARRSLWILVLSYVAVLSLNKHKEFRFVHPVLPLLCLLAGPGLRDVVMGEPSPRADRGAGDEDRARDGRHGWSRRGALGVAVAVLANLVPVLYLGLFHQTGPVSVHRDVLRLARSAAATASSTQPNGDGGPRFAVQYYTGECHSAPLHSHLHSPPLSFATRTLDCSPSCRRDGACETDRFREDPVGFVRDDLALRLVPDFVVTSTSYLAKLGPLLTELGLEEVARHPHHVRGVGLRRRRHLQSQQEPGRHPRTCWGWGDGCREGEAADADGRSPSSCAVHGVRRIRLALPFLPWDVEVPMEDVVLYSLHREDPPPPPMPPPDRLGKEGGREA